MFSSIVKHCILTFDETFNQWFLCTGYTCVNKRKQIHKLKTARTLRCYEIIYTGVPTSDTASLGYTVRHFRGLESTGEWLESVQRGKQYREAEELLSGALSNRSWMWVVSQSSVCFVSPSLSLSHLHQFRPLPEIKTDIFITKCYDLPSFMMAI